MPAVALTGALCALILLLPVRVWLQHRWTGGSGIVLRRSPPGAPRRAAALLAGGTLLVGLGPGLHLVGVAWDWTPGDVVVTRLVGALLLVGGAAWAFWAQLAMREAWRVGQDEAEQLPLVTTGPFARVRHPIYGGMVAIALGVTLLDPTYPGLLGVLAVAAGALVQALRVEEPHLRDRHGLAYHEWARRTGRFRPSVERSSRDAPRRRSTQ